MQDRLGVLQGVSREVCTVRDRVKVTKTGSLDQFQTWRPTVLAVLDTHPEINSRLMENITKIFTGMKVLGKSPQTKSSRTKNSMKVFSVQGVQGRREHIQGRVP